MIKTWTNKEGTFKIKSNIDFETYKVIVLTKLFKVNVICDRNFSEVGGKIDLTKREVSIVW